MPSRYRLPPEIVLPLRRSRAMPSGTGLRSLDDAMLLRLIGFLERDLGFEGQIESLPDMLRPKHDYFSAPLLRGAAPLPLSSHAQAGRINERDLLERVLLEANEIISDFMTAFQSLCEIQKRRMRFRQILNAHPFPDIEQLAPRGMLEAGLSGPCEASSWLRWRKFLYDIDNRAAQESSHLYIKVLAHCLGGKSHNAQTSPVRRSTDQMSRRRIDCLVEDRVYDLKTRMTEAPSRRARFGDEMSFPRDCQVSGYRPILLVLHALPGERTEELIGQYEIYGGEVHVGDGAWRHIKKNSSLTMQNFLKCYVFPWQDKVTSETGDVMDLSLKYHDGWVRKEFQRSL